MPTKENSSKIKTSEQIEYRHNIFADNKTML